MCGFTGVFDRSGQACSQDMLQLMGDTIGHRGPDYTGYYLSPSGLGLCHKRLKIIDLSDAGNQPMATADGAIQLVFNGEIYNYLELKKDLEVAGVVFKSNSDTEVLLQAYVHYGDAFITRLNGMFAFVIWDERNKKLTAARDRVGIKPFYYAFEQGVLLFGSEIKTILAHPAFRKEPEWSSIENYLLYEHPINENTWFRGIKQLAAGSLLYLENGVLSTKVYWEPKMEVDYSRSFESYRDELRETVIDAVRLNWQSDVPVGAHLSGGVDSSSIVSIASTLLSQDLHTFSSAFDYGKAFDEREEINLVKNKFKTHHHQISIDHTDVPNKLATILWHLDEPVIGPAVLPMYRISELVKSKGVVVVNGGQGVDELFAGYPPYFTHAAINLIKGNYNQGYPLRELLYLPYYLGKGGTYKRMLAKLLSSKASSAPWLRILDKYNRVHTAFEGLKNEVPKSSAFDQHAFIQFRHYLPGLLHQEDRLSMAWSIESRVPLLDNRIIDLAFQIPEHYKIRKGKSKAVFREAMRGLVPDPILDNRIKRGYPTPISVWFAGPLFTWVKDQLSTGEWYSDRLVDRVVLLHMLERQRREPLINHSYPIWKALAVEHWFRLHFTNAKTNF